MPPQDLEPVFFAPNQRDEAAAEKVLDSLGIKYSVRVEVIEERKAAGVCYQGMLYEVAPELAAKCRQLFLEAGLQRGIIEAGTRLH